MAVTTDLLVPLVIFGAIGLFLVGAGLREASLAVRLWRTRAVPIAELADASGTVTVAGRAERIDETLRSALRRRRRLAPSRTRGAFGPRRARWGGLAVTGDRDYAAVVA